MSEFERNLRTSHISGGGVEVETMVISEGKIKQIFKSYQLNVPDAIAQFKEDFAEYATDKIEISHDLLEAISTAYRDMDFTPLINLLGLKLCADCDDIYTDGDGRFYKYESGIWLCDSCHDSRMEEDE